MSGLVVLFALMIGQQGHPPGPTMSPEESTKLESKFIARPVQLTFEGSCGEGYFSPDGSKIIYQAIRGDNPFYQIYLKDLKSGEEKMVSTGFGRTTCAYFHPSGKKIIFASSHLDPNHKREADVEREKVREAKAHPQQRRKYEWSFDPHMDIFEADLDGKNLKRLTDTPGYDAEGSYSPDGERIVFSSFHGTNSCNIFTMKADGTDVKEVTNAPGYNGGPFFSPDGKQIIFRAEVRKRDYLQLFVINADGTNERQLTRNEFVNWGPYWHPNGKDIIYSTSEFGGHSNYELCLMNIETKKQQRVTFTYGADVLPVFSPDGKKLMWTSKRGKDTAGVLSSQLWMADWIFPLDGPGDDVKPASKVQ